MLKWESDRQPYIQRIRREGYGLLVHGSSNARHDPTDHNHREGNSGGLESNADEQHQSSKDKRVATAHPPDKPPRDKQVPQYVAQANW